VAIVEKNVTVTPLPIQTLPRQTLHQVVRLAILTPAGLKVIICVPLTVQTQNAYATQDITAQPIAVILNQHAVNANTIVIKPA
jgi:triosephosphate isomerase